MSRKKDFKRCPRCDTKCLIHQPKCEACGLIFSRLSYATNREAKKAIKNHKKNFVVYDKTLPKDVNKWKLFFMCLFLGMFGGHDFYVGKYLKGFFKLLSAIMLFVAAALPMSWWNDFYLASIMWILIIPSGFDAIFWLLDTFRILSNHYKVPVAIEEANMIVESNNIENKEVMKILDSVNKKVENVNLSNESSQDKANDNINLTELQDGQDAVDETDSKKSNSEQVSIKEQTKEIFVPKSKVISSQEVKNLINKKNQNKSNQNNKKKNKK